MLDGKLYNVYPKEPFIIRGENKILIHISICNIYTYTYIYNRIHFRGFASEEWREKLFYKDAPLEVPKE